MVPPLVVPPSVVLVGGVGHTPVVVDDEPPVVEPSAVVVLEPSVDALVPMGGPSAGELSPPAVVPAVMPLVLGPVEGQPL